ncbi:MAG: EamA family transporter, partial [Burkholderiaceae bacterium]
MLESTPSWLWIVFTLLAAGAQTARNAMQRGLTGTLGTAGATHVRFLFGLPFALVFLSITGLVFAIEPLQFSNEYLLWLFMGAITQILATAAMLRAMRERSFVVTTAVIKTEPIQAAVFASIALSEYLGPLAYLAILVATAGVLVMSWPNARTGPVGWQPVLIGVAGGGLFALSAVGFRGAILSLGDNPFYI